MKFNFLLLLAVGLFFTSCGSDDCTQSDWLGTWTSTDVCESTVDGVTETLTETNTFEITAGANENQIVVEGETYVIDGCSVNTSVDIDGETSSIKLELDGNTITGEFESSFTLLGQTFSLSCTTTATK